MQLEQAAFTSVRTQHTQGYHLVGRSPGIDETVAQWLSQWGPTHAALADTNVDASSLSFFHGPGEKMAVARSVYGCPEYSERGGLQVVTYFAVFQRRQLSGYENNPLYLIQSLTSAGCLRFQHESVEDLPLLEVPNHSFAARCENHRSLTPLSAELQHVTAAIQDDRRVAVLGSAAPHVSLEQLFLHTPSDQRLELTFTTGLKPSVHRPFRLAFFPQADARLKVQLTQQGITCIEEGHGRRAVSASAAPFEFHSEF